MSRGNEAESTRLRVNFQRISYQHLSTRHVGMSLPGFRPELALCATIVLMLLARISRSTRAGCELRCCSSARSWPGAGRCVRVPRRTWPAAGRRSDRDLHRHAGVRRVRRCISARCLLLFAVLFALFTRLSGIPDRDDGADFYTLVLGATLGMCLMASANHLLMVFLGVEMASVPSYALAGMLKGRRRSSEAALKYAVFGAGTAGVMLYGISLLAGATRLGPLPTMARRSWQPCRPKPSPSAEAGLGAGRADGGLVGLAFKLSAVPFHFWCPDVFEGARPRSTRFLSVASKAAALALLLRVATRLHAPTEHDTGRLSRRRAAVLASAAERSPSQWPRLRPRATAGHSADPQRTTLRLGEDDCVLESRDYIVGLIAFLAAITCTFGNLAAYGQTNIKRLLGLFHDRPCRLHDDAGRGRRGPVGQGSANRGSERAVAAWRSMWASICS